MNVDVKNMPSDSDEISNESRICPVTQASDDARASTSATCSTKNDNKDGGNDDGSDNDDDDRDKDTSDDTVILPTSSFCSL